VAAARSRPGTGSAGSGSSAAAAARPEEEASFEAAAAAAAAARAAATLEERATGSAVADQRFWGDPRLLEKPDQFDGSPERWSEWRFRFVAWFSAVVPNAATALEEAAAARTEIDMTAASTPLVRSGGFLYAALASYCRGLPLQMVRAAEAGNGWEAWRALNQEYEPRLAARKLAMLTSMLSPDLGTEKNCLEKFMQWERELKKNESVIGISLPEDLRIAVAMQRLPSALKQHVQLHAADIGGSYERFRVVLVSYLQARRQWSVGG